ncbi:hypothetical protein [Caldalkalibacillus mannanilyticus]|uniref:hypothetical protein n=1 Tax=Caldalkalibacillus mannanilyticus TaxID=1418 RepID=UPI000B28F927|nr:hypothetical protein [Caldalkalibacillus mannanilyticus]
MTVYQINPSGQLIYHPCEDVFIAVLSECNIKIKIEDLIDMILQERFIPILPPTKKDEPIQKNS